MKKPSGGLEAGLGVAAGLVVAYLGGFLILVSFPIYNKLPPMLQAVVRIVYEPLLNVLASLGIR